MESSQSWSFIKTQLKAILLISLCLSFFSCGMVKDEKVDSTVYEIDKLTSICKINTDKFKKIFREDIGAEINCLENNLNKFSLYVKGPKKGEIQRTELIKFVKKFMDVDPILADRFLKLIYKFNSLLLQDREGSLTLENINPLMKLLRTLNQRGSKIRAIIKRIDEKGYMKYRSLFLSEVESFSNDILDISKNKKGHNFETNILDLIDDVLEIANSSETKLDFDLIKELIFIKRVVLGGDKNSLASSETNELFRILPNIVEIYFDLTKVKRADFKSDTPYYEFLLNATTSLNEIFEVGSAGKYMTDDELLSALENILPDHEWNKYKSAIDIFKKDVLGGDPSLYSYKNIKTLTGYAQDAVETLFYFTHTYDSLESELLLNKPFSRLVFPRDEEYSLIANIKLREFKRKFLDIAKRHRLFPGEGSPIYFGYNYKRSREGFLLQGLLGYAGDILFKAYHSGKDKEGYYLKEEKLKQVIVSYKQLLVELDLWPNDLNRMVRELLLGSDLFQFASNGDARLQQIELSQYIPVVINASKIGKEVYEKVQDYCDLIPEKGFVVPCYRRHFFPTFFYDVKKEEYYPNLLKFFKKSPWNTSQDFLKNIEQMARIKPDENIPMSKVDITRLITSLSNTESLFIRFDKNKNDIIDRKELDDVFELLRDTLAEKANLNPKKKIVKSLFFYLLKEKKQPDSKSLLVFHLFGKTNDIKVDRPTLASVLKMFGPKKK